MPLRFSYLSVTRRLFLIALLAAVFLPPAPTSADPRFAPLSKPGVVVIVRHARATGTGDPASFTLDNCATQRNLHSQGRKQAREIGAAIRAAVATVHWALTCRWCRCRDTASLLDLGPVEDLPALNSFFRNRNAGAMSTQNLAGVHGRGASTEPAFAATRLQSERKTSMVSSEGRTCIRRNRKCPDEFRPPNIAANCAKRSQSSNKRKTSNGRM